MAIATAVGSALLYALASVLQHRAAVSMPADRSMRMGLLLGLGARPLWVLGIAADLGAYALQFVALGHGSLVLVQPILVTGLLIALPIGAAMTHRRLNRREWLSSGAVVCGLALFLVVASPAQGAASASPKAWVAMGLSGAAFVVSMIWLSGPPGTVRRACLLAAAAGVVIGIAAALTKTTSRLLSDGGLHVLAGWEPYALLACGAIGLLLTQSAFQAGPIRWSLPMLTVTETVSGIAIGALALHESVDNSPGALALELIGLAAMGVGVFGLGQGAAFGDSKPKLGSASGNPQVSRRDSHQGEPEVE